MPTTNYITRREFGVRTAGGVVAVTTGGLVLAEPEEAEAFIAGLIVALFSIAAAITKISLEAAERNSTEWNFNRGLRQADMQWLKNQRKLGAKEFRQARREMRIARRSHTGADYRASLIEAMNSRRTGIYDDPATAFGAAAVWHHHDRQLIPLSGGGYEDQHGDRSTATPPLSSDDDLKKEAGDFLGLLNKKTAAAVGINPGITPADADKFEYFVGFKRA